MFQRKTKFRKLLLEALQARNMFTAYFIDPIHGSDDNSGLTSDSALATPAELVSYYNPTDRPTDYKGLKPGDEVVLMPGVHDFTYQYDQTTRGFFLRNVHGAEDNPIVIRGMPGAMVRSKSTDGSELAPIDILQSSFITIQGLDVSAKGSGIVLAETEGAIIRDNYIHNVDGEANNNASGIYLTDAHGTLVERNLLADNYDREKVGDQNNRHIVIFGSRDVRILDNHMTNAIPNAGQGVEYKHLGSIAPNEKYTLEVARNIIVNATGVGIGSSAANSHIHHNLLLDSGAIRFDDIGGTHQLSGELAEYNTIVNTLDNSGSGGLLYDPTEAPGFPMGTVEWRNNLVVDQRKYSESERNTVSVFQYGTDQEYLDSIGRGLLQADNNVYSTLDPARFNVFGANHHALGRVFDFEGWQKEGYDQNGAVIESALDAMYHSQDPSAQDAGWYSNDSARLTLIVSESTTQVPGTASQASLHIIRSGGSFEDEATVTLSATGSGWVDLPCKVTIPAGERSITIPFSALWRERNAETTLLQVTATSTSFESGRAWVRLKAPQIPSCPVMNDGSFFKLPENQLDCSDCGIIDLPTEVMADGVFQLPGSAGTFVDMNSFVNMRWAQYNNEIGFAYVDNARGQVGDLLPSDEGWLQALMSRSQHHVLHASGAKEGDRSQTKAEAGRYIVFYLAQNATTEEWAQLNPTNSLSLETNLFVSVATANPDQFDHVHEKQSEGSWQLAWEDLDFGGDNSFRDMVLDIDFDFQVQIPSFLTAVDDVFREFGGEKTNVLAVLQNDHSEAPLEITAVSQSPAGNVAIATGGSALEFTPAKGVYGPVQFSYTIQSGGLSSTANVEIDVVKQWTNPANHLDVDGDGSLTMHDVIAVVSALDRSQAIDVVDHPTSKDAELEMIDVNGDRQITITDALQAIVGLLDHTSAAPTAITLSNLSVAENTSAGTSVGTFSSNDANAGDTHTYTLVTGSGDTDNRSFTISTSGVLSTAASFNFDVKDNFSIRVRCTDNGGSLTDRTFNIAITKVNEAPTAIALSNSSVINGSTSGTLVGSLSTTDPDAGNKFTYELVSGAGDDDNSLFRIVDGNLTTAFTASSARKNSYSVRVRATD